MKGHRLRIIILAVLLGTAAASVLPARAADAPGEFKGRWFSGRGDVEYLQLLDIARRMFEPDPEFQNLPMLYTPAWNGLVEGPTWDAWWIQNSYGTDLLRPAVLAGAVRHLPAELAGPLVRPDGRRQAHAAASRTTGWRPTAACATPPARAGSIYKQGDGRVDIHDWGMEFTAAGVRDAGRAAADQPRRRGHRPLPAQARALRQLHRDPPRPEEQPLPGRPGRQPAGAELRRLEEARRHLRQGLPGRALDHLHRRAGPADRAGEAGRPRRTRPTLYAERRELARKGLPLLTTDEGYFIKSLDPDGTKHGVFGAAKHGYFEAVANHDAICFRVVDDAQAEQDLRQDRLDPRPAAARPHHHQLSRRCDDMYERARRASGSSAPGSTAGTGPPARRA